MWWKKKTRKSRAARVTSPGEVVSDELTEKTLASLGQDVISDPEVMNLLMSGSFYYDGRRMYRVDDGESREGIQG